MNYSNVETKPSKTAPKRKYYSASFKKRVVEYSEQFGNRKAGNKFCVDESNVRRWKKNIQKIKLAIPKRKAFTGPKSGRFKDIDDTVFTWVTEQRNSGMPVSRKAIRIKALRVARSMDLSRQQFKASIGWCHRMMRRCGLSLRRRTTIAQKLPNDYTEKLIQYQRYIIKLRKKNNYSFSAIGNADETPVFFDMPSNTTVNSKGAKTVSIRSTGAEKQRVTVMLCVLADGTKLPPYIILKRKLMPKETLPTGLYVKCQHKGWMTAELMLDWIKCVWNKRHGVLLNKDRSLLILDAFRGHLDEKVKKSLASGNSDLVIIPGGMTSVLQVLDVVVNKPFKDHLRELYSNWLINNSHEYTKTGRIKKPSVQLISEWILKSWDKISPESIRKGFKKCCVTNALDGSEDTVLWEDEDQQQSAGKSSSDSDEIIEIPELDSEEEMPAVGTEDYERENDNSSISSRSNIYSNSDHENQSDDEEVLIFEVIGDESESKNETSSESSES